MEAEMFKKFIEKESEKVGFIIATAIEEGATKEIVKRDQMKIEGKYIFRNGDGTCSIVLSFKNKTVMQAFEPSKEDLEKQAEQKRAELEEIENQIKEREANNETDHN